MQRRRRGLLRGCLHLIHDDTDAVRVAAAQRGLGEIADRVAADRVVVGGIGRVMDAPQVRECVCGAAGAESGEAAGELRRREHGAGADRHAGPLGLGGERFSGLMVAAQRG